MRRMLALLIACTAALPGCFTAGVEATVARGSRHSDVGWTWFWGVSNTITDAQQCRKGLAEVETWLPWYAYLIAPLTFGIVTPIKKQYVCAD